MKKKNLWMLTTILYCGLGMTLTSCSDSDDNDNGKEIIDPSTDEDGYKIEVGEGMTMPENEFKTKVPATTDFDQAIVDALKAIDNVTDVKPFKIAGIYDYFKKENITKTAYYFNFKQPIDHNNPSKGWYKQQCMLTVAGKDRPTVLHTEGYALEEDNNRLDIIGEPALVPALNANCLQVEYRYHGWSLPEGYTNKWNYLTAKQHSDDLHAIVTAIKKSGIISQSSKWVSTGVSKNGMTTAHYAYYYPNDMDAYVPFCAPFLLNLNDKRPYEYILDKKAFNDDEERYEKVKAAFRAYVGNRNLQAECVKLYKQQAPSMAASSDEDVRKDLLANLFENYYSKMSYVTYERWEPLIPQAGDNAKKFLDFILANGRTKYNGEDQFEYDRRKYYYTDFESSSYSDESSDSLVSRGADAVIRKDAYFVQVCIELGTYGYATKGSATEWVDDLLTAEEKKYLLESGHNPSAYGVTYDNGKFINEFFEGMKKSDCHMKFVYGMQDPWTGGQIPDDKMGPNSSKLFISYGKHDDAIDKWNPSERNDLLQWLAGLGFNFE